MEIKYKKNNNNNLFEEFKKKNLLNIETIQNYIPIYNNFFNLTEKNYNNINLNNKNRLYSLKEKISDNKFKGIIIDDDNNSICEEKYIFFKLSPLLDPVKYIMNKYDICNNNFPNKNFR